MVTEVEEMGGVSLTCAGGQVAAPRGRSDHAVAVGVRAFNVSVDDVLTFDFDVPGTAAWESSRRGSFAHFNIVIIFIVVFFSFYFVCSDKSLLKPRNMKTGGR